MFWTGIFNLILILFLGINDPAPRVNPDFTLISLKSDAPAFKLEAQRGAVLAAGGHLFLFTSRADEVQPIASITKLMTALVFLEHNPGWSKVYKISGSDKVEGGRLNLFLGDQVTVKDLFYTSLVASDNGATIALVHATGLSEKEFVRAMNQKAQKIGLRQTSFEDPVGLSDNDVSTAREVALLAQAALSQAEIREVTTKSEYRFTTLDGREKVVESTDYLLFNPAADSLQVMGGKTGYTEKAGYCFVGRLKSSSGQELISVVLNSSGKNERFVESRDLANWVFNSYNWSK